MTNKQRPLIPVNQEGLDSVAEALLAGNTGNGNSGENTGRKLEVKVDASKYIQVGTNGLNGNPVVISPFELVGHGNLDYEKVHFKLAESGLYMPTPRIFMTHFSNVVDAFKSKKKLIYADGSEVPKDVVEDMYKHLTINHKAIYGGNAGAWTWLNARFVNGTGFNGMDLETVVEVKNNKLKITKEKLESSIGQNSFVDISFNNQGLAKKPSGNQAYSQGNNIYFWTPIKDKVARFVAVSGWAFLSCYRNPSDAGSDLGVFGCAEGAVAKIGGNGK